MLSVPGALVAPPGSGGPVTEDPLPADVQADLGALRLPARDPQGRPIVTLPRYGEAWDAAAPDQSQWARDLNLDPRHRGIAGLGLQTGIDAQEDLVADVLASLGALQEARQRIRHLTLGLAASRSLWQRRVPADPPARLWLLGPAVNRLVTSDGTVGDLATAADRTIAPGTFSAAARRVLRAGPARTTLATADLTPATLITSANRQPPPPPASIDGIPLDDTGLRALDTASAQVIRSGHVNTGTLLAAATELARRLEPGGPAGRHPAGHGHAAGQPGGQGGALGQAMAMLAAGDATVTGQGRDPATTLNVLSRNMSALRDRFADQADDADLTQMLAALRPLPPGDPALSPVSAEALAAGVTAAFDPSADDAPAAARVLATIGGGIDPAQPLAPPELSVQLDRPAWADLAAAGAQWLLPGVGQLPANSVIALQSDPIFIDGYLTGLNTQLLGELRWRNIPVATGCTPIRRFWDRADTATGEPADDITGITSWTASSGLGDQTHLAPGATGQELVIAVRGELLLRYPTTLVYLQPAVPPGATTADFDADPDPAAAPVLPGIPRPYRRRRRVLRLPRAWTPRPWPATGWSSRNRRLASGSPTTCRPARAPGTNGRLPRSPSRYACSSAATHCASGPAHDRRPGRAAAHPHRDPVQER